ncbi:MAG: hypothetical protein LC660_17100 [Desulfobacteraceae bacterium]|nr:hypothetical protein [Desulfobacteraceae bacterium]
MVSLVGPMQGISIENMDLIPDRKTMSSFWAVFVGIESGYIKVDKLVYVIA